MSDIASREKDETPLPAVESQFNLELIFYGIVLFCSSAVFGLLIRRAVPNQFSYVALPVPVACWALIIFRARFFEALIPAATLCCIAMIGMISGASFLTLSGRLIALAAIANIASATRYQSLARSNTALIASSRINYTPIARVRPVSRRWSFGHVFSVPLIIVAWIGGGILCRDLSAFQSRNAYNAIYSRLNAGIGLLPEWNAGIKTLLTLSFILWLAHKVFEYFQIRQSGGSVAAMHLRSELWKWNSWEQRTISQQLQKRKRSEQ